jgi:hypothetical protein
MYITDCEERGYFFQKLVTQLIVLKMPYFGDNN